jgi:hypothetical protein
MLQIMESGDNVTFNFEDIDDNSESEGKVIVNFVKKDGKYGKHEISFNKFIEFLSNSDPEWLLSSLTGMAYNDLQKRNGSSEQILV